MMNKFVPIFIKCTLNTTMECIRAIVRVCVFVFQVGIPKCSQLRCDVVCKRSCFHFQMVLCNSFYIFFSSAARVQFSLCFALPLASRIETIVKRSNEIGSCTFCVNNSVVSNISWIIIIGVAWHGIYLTWPNAIGLPLFSSANFISCQREKFGITTLLFGDVQCNVFFRLEYGISFSA